MIHALELAQHCWFCNHIDVDPPAGIGAMRCTPPTSWVQFSISMPRPDSVYRGARSGTVPEARVPDTRRCAEQGR